MSISYPELNRHAKNIVDRLNDFNSVKLSQRAWRKSPAIIESQRESPFPKIYLKLSPNVSPQFSGEVYLDFFGHIDAVDLRENEKVKVVLAAVKKYGAGLDVRYNVEKYGVVGGKKSGLLIEGAYSVPQLPKIIDLIGAADEAVAKVVMRNFLLPMFEG